MTPFAVAGIQMYLGMQNNVEQMRSRLEVLMHLYPWTQMVMFSELAPHGPALQSAQPAGGADEQAFQEMARRHKMLAGAGLDVREARRRDLQHDAGDQPRGRGGGALPQDVPLRAL